MRRYFIPTRLRSVFIAALAVAFLPAAATAADPVAYLPDGTMLVVSFNVQQFLESPLIRDGGNFKPFVKDAVHALEGFGVDPTKDSDRVLLAVGEQLRASSMLMLFQGRFDADKVQKRLKDRAKDRKADIEVLDEGGATVFQCRLPAPPPNARVALPGQFYMTVMDSSTIALGIDRAAVTEVLAKKAGRRKTEIKPRIVELVGRIDPKETLSFVFVPPADFLTGGPMNGLTTMTGGLTVTDGVKTDIRLDAKDAESAKLLADNVRDGLGKVREILPGLATLQLGLDRKDQDVIREMLESFKVTARPDGVTIAGAISKDQIDKIGRK
jgi:hypothetical protein